MKLFLTTLIFLSCIYSKGQPPIKKSPTLPAIQWSVDTVPPLWSVEWYQGDTIIRGDRDLIIKQLIIQRMNSDSIKNAAEDILSVITTGGYITDWKKFKKYGKEYLRLKNKNR